MLRVLAVAEAEAEAAAKWYQQRREGLGIEFLAEFGDVLQLIERTPMRFPVISSTRQREFRRATLGRFPYNVVYEIRGEEDLCSRSSTPTSKTRLLEKARNLIGWP